MLLCNLLDDWVLEPQDAELVVTGITADSRKVEEGFVFVALKGTATDGHDFITDAVAKGAIAIIGENEAPASLAKPYYKSDNIRLTLTKACARFWPKRTAIQAAITGTNGKTSIAEFLRQLWHNASWNAASLGTIGVRTAAPALKMELPSLTTLGPEDLYRAIDELARSSVKYLALEASSHGLEQERLSALDIHVAGFTNLSRDHLDYHGDMESYFASKAKLFTDILPDGAAAVINIETDYGRTLFELIKDRQIVAKTIGYGAEADLQILEITPTIFGFDCRFSYKDAIYKVPVALHGRFQAENAILAALMAHLSGLPPQDTFGALPRLKPIIGRMQPVHGHPEGAQILVDYAHTPDALESVLAHLREDAIGKLIVLFGCGGDRDKGKRALMGNVAKQYADEIYITDDNPRTEDPASIRAEIMGKNADDFIEIGDREKAIRTAIGTLKAGDILLIAGKGHETTQMTGHESLPFDDAAIARTSLSFLPAAHGGSAS